MTGDLFRPVVNDSGPPLTHFLRHPVACPSATSVMAVFTSFPVLNPGSLVAPDPSGQNVTTYR